MYYIEKDGGYFIKSAPKGVLLRESEMDRYFHKKGLSPEMLYYGSGEGDLLLTACATGRDGTHFVDAPKAALRCDGGSTSRSA